MCVPTEFRRKMILQIIEALKESPSFRDISLSQIKEAVLNSEHQTFQQSKTKDEYIFFINEKIKKIQKNSECKNFSKGGTDGLAGCRYTGYEFNGDASKEFGDYDKSKIINGKIPAHVNISQMYSQDQAHQYSNLGRKMETFAASFEQCKRHLEMNGEKGNAGYPNAQYQDYSNANKTPYPSQEYYKMPNSGYPDKAGYSYEMNGHSSYSSSPMQINIPKQSHNQMQPNYHPPQMNFVQNYNQGFNQNGRHNNFGQMQPLSGSYSNPPNQRFPQYGNRGFHDQQEKYSEPEDYGRMQRNAQFNEMERGTFNGYRPSNFEISNGGYQQPPGQFAGFSPYGASERNQPGYTNRDSSARMESFQGRSQSVHESGGHFQPENNSGAGPFFDEPEQQKMPQYGRNDKFNQADFAANRPNSDNRSFIGNANPNLYDFTSSNTKAKPAEKSKSLVFDDKRSEEIFKSIGEEFAKTGRFSGLESGNSKSIFGNEGSLGLFGNSMAEGTAASGSGQVNTKKSGNNTNERNSMNNNSNALESELFSGIKSHIDANNQVHRLGGQMFHQRNQPAFIKAERKSINIFATEGNELPIDNNIVITSPDCGKTEFKEAGLPSSSDSQQKRAGTITEDLIDTFCCEMGKEGQPTEASDLLPKNDNSLGNFLDSDLLFPFKPVNDNLASDECEVPSELDRFLKEHSLELKEVEDPERWRASLHSAFMKAKEAGRPLLLLEMQLKFIDFCFLDEHGIEDYLANNTEIPSCSPMLFNSAAKEIEDLDPTMEMYSDK